MQQELPIDALLPDVLRRLATDRRLILEAPPGAGKTTRIPPALAHARFCDGRVVVGQPRRLAARLAAHRVAEELGEPVGGTVGYRVRFDEKFGPQTRILFETQGLMLRRLLSTDGLKGVGVLVFDEVHERSVELDASLALLNRALEAHPELRAVMMSATLDTSRLEAHFAEASGGNVSKLRSCGRAFPVHVQHEPRPDDRPLEIRIRSAVMAARERAGDVLVFLPGAGEIRRTEQALTGRVDRDVLALHGDLPLKQQASVVHASPTAAPRVILATNIAETSVTIPRVTTVIDTGLARIAQHDPFSGVQRLVTREISQARCIQRTGRAGRVTEGQCMRLFTKGNFEARPAHDVPEVLRSDLSSVLLTFLAQGVDPRALDWLSPPAPADWRKAEEQLEALGAVDEAGISAIGRRMAELGLPPRLARVLVEGSGKEVEAKVVRAVALLAERDIVQRRSSAGDGRDVEVGDSDLDDRIERLEQAAEGGFDRRLLRDLDLDGHAVRRVHQLCRQLESVVNRRKTKQPKRSAAREAHDARNVALLRCLFAGFPDRVAQRRSEGRRLVLSTGLTATLSEGSCVQNANLLLVLSAIRGRKDETMVHWAARLHPDWLLDFRPDLVEARDTLTYNEKNDRIERVSQLSYGKLVLDESRSLATAGTDTKAFVLALALAKGPAVYDPRDGLTRLAVRLQLLLEHASDELPPWDVSTKERLRSWADDVDTLRHAALEIACESATSIDELVKCNLDELVLSLETPELGRVLTEQVPTCLTLPSGQHLTIHYERDRQPWVSSRLQDFFSVTKTPRLCAARLPVQVHLLAPNRRAVQITQDLEGFWERHYPELRRQLMRRYPKHSFPEDGRTAKPPPPGRLR